jgi:hypothetical protein
MPLRRTGTSFSQFQPLYYKWIKREVKEDQYMIVSCFNDIGRSFVYYESMKKELQTRPIYECRSDE